MTPWTIDLDAQSRIHHLEHRAVCHRNIWGQNMPIAADDTGKLSQPRHDRSAVGRGVHISLRIIVGQHLNLSWRVLVAHDRWCQLLHRDWVRLETKYFDVR